MLKKHIAACMFATALVAAPAMAQTDMQPSPSAPTAPLMNDAAPATPSPEGAAPSGALDRSTGVSGIEGAEVTLEIVEPGHDLQLQGGFIVSQTVGHHLSGDMIGVSVMSAEDENVGTINELVIDGENRVVGVVVGVGGFLGVGQRDVAIPLSDVEFVYDVDATASTGAGEPVARDISEARIAMTRAEIEDAPVFARLEAAPAAAPAAPAPTPMGGATAN